MRALGSLVMREADATKLPAGSALAVDRDLFAQRVTRALADHPNVALVRERIDTLPGEGSTIVATGPLTAAALADSIGRSEEHTSELQSLMRISYAVFCLKKNTKKNKTSAHRIHNKKTTDHTK